MKNIYEVPSSSKSAAWALIVEKLNLGCTSPTSEAGATVDKMESIQEKVIVALCGKYTELHDATSCGRSSATQALTTRQVRFGGQHTRHSKIKVE